jgi:hypothetical protein
MPKSAPPTLRVAAAPRSYEDAGASRVAGVEAFRGYAAFLSANARRMAASSSKRYKVNENRAAIWL